MCCTFCGFRQMCKDMFYHCTIIQSSFTALKIPCSTYSSLALPYPLATTNIFTAFVVLPFPEDIIVIVCYVAFVDWLHLLSNMLSSSCISFYGTIAHFLLALTSIPLSGGTIIYLSTLPLKHILVASKFW